MVLGPGRGRWDDGDGARRAGARRGRGWRVLGMMSTAAMQSVHVLLAVKARWRCLQGLGARG